MCIDLSVCATEVHNAAVLTIKPVSTWVTNRAQTTSLSDPHDSSDIFMTPKQPRLTQDITVVTVMT